VECEITGAAKAIPVDRLSQVKRGQARVTRQKLVVSARGGENRKGAEELVENLSAIQF
jgi:hypothetical protein